MYCQTVRAGAAFLRARLGLRVRCNTGTLIYTVLSTGLRLLTYIK